MPSNIMIPAWNLKSLGGQIEAIAGLFSFFDRLDIIKRLREEEFDANTDWRKGWVDKRSGKKLRYCIRQALKLEPF